MTKTKYIHNAKHTAIQLFVSKKADAPIKTLVLFFFLFVVLSIVMEFMRGMTVLNGAKDSLDRAVVSVATANSYNAYQGFREGDAAVVSSDDNFLGGSIDLDDVIDHLEREIPGSMRDGNAIHSFMGDGTPHYVITNIQTWPDDEDSVRRSGSDHVNFTSTATIQLPMEFFLRKITVNIDIHVKTYYRTMFDYYPDD